MNGKTSGILCILSLAVILAVLFAGCTTQPSTTATPTPTAVATPVATTAAVTANATAAPTTVVHEPGTLLIATTTSLYDTGLLNMIQDTYQNKTGVKLKITSQGTGQSIALAQRGDVDLLLVHSPSQEKTFIDNGYGTNQRCFAYNYFMIVGPANDPAGIKGSNATTAFAKIDAAGMDGKKGVAFVSRGDSSGTHTAEQGIWAKAGFNYTKNITNAGPWYISIGKGMGDTLLMASQKGAYTLTDEGTYLAYKSQLNLTPLVTNDTVLLNRYSAIAVSPAKNPNVNQVEADKFINWLISPEGRKLVGDYGVDKYGKGLFTPLTPELASQAQFNCTCCSNVAPV